MAKSGAKNLGRRAVERLRAAAGYTDFQLAVVGAHATALLNRNWFQGIFEPDAQPYMARLLIGVYLCQKEGFLPTKKQALEFMNATHGKTSQRYIGLAQAKGLVTVTQSKLDQRVDYLRPTEKLLDIVRSELAELANDLRFAMDGLVHGDLPSNGAPTFHRGSIETEQSLSRFLPPFEARRLVAEPGPLPTTEHAIERKRRINSYTETLRLMPTNVGAYLWRAWYYKQDGNLESAIADITQAIRLDPTNVILFDFRAKLLAEKENFLEALADYTEAIRVSGNQSWQHVQRAQFYRDELKDYLSAADDFTQSIQNIKKEQKNPAIASCYRDRAEIFIKLGKRDEAIADLRAAMQFMPSSKKLKDQLKELGAGEDNTT